jgi:hypothetical protein
MLHTLTIGHRGHNRHSDLDITRRRGTRLAASAPDPGAMNTKESLNCRPELRLDNSRYN